MPNRKAIVSSAAHASSKVLKPPQDLWELMDKARTATFGEEPPVGSFSIQEYANRFCIGHAMAKGQIAHMVKSGRLADCGMHGSKHFYCMVVK
jgi:hypothetical protein